MLTDDLVQAVCEALDFGGDRVARAALLACTRATLAQWTAGLLSAETAAARIRRLRVAHGVVSRRLSVTHQPNGAVVSTPTSAYSPACPPTSW